MVTKLPALGQFFQLLLGQRVSRKGATMQTRITARHFELSDALKDLAEEHSQRLSRYFNHIIDSHWVLTKERMRNTAELTVKVYGTVLTCKVDNHDVAIAVEKAAQKMQAQIKKYKDRLKEKNVKKLNSMKESEVFRPTEAEL